MMIITNLRHSISLWSPRGFESENQRRCTCFDGVLFGKLIKIRCIQTCSKSTTTRRYVWRVLHVDKDGGVNSSAERSCPEINAVCRGKVREDALGSNHRPGTLTALVVDAKKEVPHPCVLRLHVSGGIGYSVFYGNTSLKDVGVESGSVHEHTK